MASSGTKIRGITIELGADTSGIQQGLKDIQGSLSKTQKSLRDVDKLLKLDPKNTELLSQKQTYLKKAIDDTKKKIEQEQAALKKLQQSGDTSKTQEQQNALKRDIEATKQSLAKYEDELDNTNKALDGYGNEMNEADQETKEFDATAQLLAKRQLAEFFNKVGEATKKLAAGAVSAAKELDVGYDTIVKKTGATGEQFEKLKKIADDLYGSMPAEMEDIGKAVGEVNTRLGLTGEDLKETAKRFLEFSRINDVDVSTSVDTVQKALSAFGLTADDTSRILDVMTAAGQDSGVGMNELAGAMVKNAGALSELGLSAEQSIMFIGRLEKSGVDSETALSGMSRALKNATKNGTPLNKALEELENTILENDDGMSGLQKSYDLFGKSGDKIYNALKTGSISFKNLTQDVKDYSGTVSRTYEQTISPWEKTQQAMQNLKKIGSELAGSALSQLTPIIEKLAGWLKTLAEKFDRLSPGAKKIIGIIAALTAGAAILAPKLAAVVQVINTMKMASAVSKGMQALTGATGGATAATKLFNAALLANPIVAVTAAIIAAVAAIGAITWSLAKASDESVQFSNNARAISDASKQVSSEAQNIANEAATAVSQFEAQEQIASELIGTIERLSGKEKKSAEEVLELRQAVRQLNEIYPELNASYDEASDTLNMTNKELEDNIELLQKQAKMQTYSKLYSELLEKQTRLHIDELALQNQLNDAREEYGELVEKQKNRIVATMIFNPDEAKTMREVNSAVKELNSGLDENQKAISSTDAEMQALQSEMSEMGLTIDPVTGEVKEFSSATRDAAAAEGEMGAATDELSPRWSTLSESQQALADNVVQAFTNMKDAVQQSVQSQISWFDEYTAAEELHAADLNKNLSDQIEAVRQWEENLTILADRGINQGLLEELSQMGPKGASYVQAFVNASDDELSQANSLWSEALNIQGFTNDEAVKLGTGITTMAAGGEAAMNDLANSLGEAGSAAGEMTGAGLVEGIQKKKSEAETAGEEVGEAGIDGIEKGAGVHSPSIYARAAGMNVGLGLKMGMESQRGQVRSTAMALGAAADLRSFVLPYVPAAVSSGLNVSLGLARGISAGRAAVIQAAASTAASAIQAARQTLQIHSPSRVFEYLGRMTGEGYERGLKLSLGSITQTVTADFSALANFRPASIDNQAIYDAVRAGSSEAAPVIYLDGRQVTRGLKGLGVSFG